MIAIRIKLIYHDMINKDNVNTGALFLETVMAIEAGIKQSNVSIFPIRIETSLEEGKD